MPRDSSGNYTLPLGNPVVDGTIIETTWANPTMSDIALQLNNVLTRDGLLGPLTPLKLQDGTEVQPGLSFNSQIGTGLWRNATQVGFSYQGTKVWTANAAGMAVKSQITLTNPTTDPGNSGFWPDVTPTAIIWRQRDRLFVGGAAASTGNFSGSQGGIIPSDTNFNAWAVRDSTLLAVQDIGLMAVTGYAINTNMNMAGGQPVETIGVSGLVKGVKAGRDIWGLYSDVVFQLGDYGYGIEIAVKNQKIDETSTPYFATTGTYGVWLAGGAGSATHDGLPVLSCNTAIAIGANDATWNKGIVFFAGGITGTNGTTGTGTAIEMAKGHRVVWRAPGNLSGFSIRSDVSAASSDVSMTAGNNSILLSGTGGASLAVFNHQASAVNYWQIINRATGASPVMQAIGSDTNVDAAIQGQGAGGVRLRDGTSATRLSVDTTGIYTFGNVVMAAPSSGVGLIQGGFAGSDTVQFNGGTSGSFRVTDRGLPYGTSIHNNAGAVNGTTNQYIASGTYTPTPTAAINCTVPSATLAQWIRVGNVVTVSGQFFASVTANLSLTEVYLTIPIASNLAGTYELAGTHGDYTTSSYSADNGCAVYGDIVSDRATMRWIAGNNGPSNRMYTYTYVVK